MMNKFVWGNIKDPKVLIDNFHNLHIATTRYRNNFLRLAEALLNEAYDPTFTETGMDTVKIKAAVEVLDRSLEELPLCKIAPEYVHVYYVPVYYMAQEYEKGNNLARAIIVDNMQHLRYYMSLDPRRQQAIQREGDRGRIVRILLEYAEQAGQTEFVKEIEELWDTMFNPQRKRIVEHIVTDTVIETEK